MKVMFDISFRVYEVDINHAVILLIFWTNFYLISWKSLLHYSLYFSHLKFVIVVVINVSIYL